MSGRYTEPDFAASALVTIDTQRDVLDGGALEIPGTSAALGPMRRLAEEFRAVGRPIVHVVRLYEPDGSNVDLCRRHAVESGERLLRTGAPGTELASELLPEHGIALDCPLLLAGAAIYKPRWGAFYRTPLEDHLRAQAVSTLVFSGCNFPNCPRTSIYEASERDFRIVLARDAVSGLYERGERELDGIGVHLMSAAQVIASLGVAMVSRR
ncbi:MAG: cysteine hydrolase [Actinobacteria bacterium]|nr:MAG: cysteine hydrolase [Actinomycetota bacterium]